MNHQTSYLKIRFLSAANRMQVATLIASVRCSVRTDLLETVEDKI